MVLLAFACHAENPSRMVRLLPRRGGGSQDALHKRERLQALLQGSATRPDACWPASWRAALTALI